MTVEWGVKKEKKTLQIRKLAAADIVRYVCLKLTRLTAFERGNGMKKDFLIGFVE